MEGAGGEEIIRRGRRDGDGDSVDGPDGAACTWHFVCPVWTVSRTCPGLRRELEAFYSSRALLMSWRPFRTVCQADLVPAAIDFQYFGSWRCRAAHDVSVSCHPSVFDRSGAGRSNRDNQTMRFQQGQGPDPQTIDAARLSSRPP